MVSKQKAETDEPFFVLDWFVCKVGYKLIGEQIVPVSFRRKDHASYKPLQVRDLYHEFAKIETPEDALAFANSYGLTGCDSHDRQAPPQSESVNSWISESERMRRVDQIWSLHQLILKYQKQLKYGLSASERNSAPTNLKNEEKEFISKFQELAKANPDYFFAWAKAPKLGRTNYSELVDFCIRSELEEALNRHPIIIRFPHRRTQAVPTNLISALWLQLAIKIEGDIQKRRCLVCRRIIEVSKGYLPSQRAYAKTCKRPRPCRNRLGWCRKRVRALLKTGAKRNQILQQTQYSPDLIDFLLLETKHRKHKSSSRTKTKS